MKVFADILRILVIISLTISIIKDKNNVYVKAFFILLLLTMK